MGTAEAYRCRVCVCGKDKRWREEGWEGGGEDERGGGRRVGEGEGDGEGGWGEGGLRSLGGGLGAWWEERVHEILE